MKRIITWILIVRAVGYYGRAQVSDTPLEWPTETVRQVDWRDWWEQVPPEWRQGLPGPTTRIPTLPNVRIERDTPEEIPEITDDYDSRRSITDYVQRAALEGTRELDARESEFLQVALERVYGILNSPDWLAAAGSPVLEYPSQRRLPEIPATQLTQYYLREMSERESVPRTRFRKTDLAAMQLAENRSSWVGFVRDNYRPEQIAAQSVIVFDTSYMQDRLREYENGYTEWGREVALSKFASVVAHEIAHSYGHLHPNGLPQANDPRYFINWLTEQVENTRVGN